MTEHLTPSQLAALRTQSASSTESFELLEHAVSCSRCSELIVSDRQMLLEIASLRQTLKGLPEHLSLDELNDFVDNLLPAVEAGRINSHLNECQMCSSDVAELRKLATPSTEPKQRRQGLEEWLRTFFARPSMLLTAAALILVVAVSGWLASHRREMNVQNAQAGAAPSNLPNERTPQQQAGEKEQTSNRDQSVSNTTARRSTLAVALIPGLLRSADSAKTLEVSGQIKTLKITLTSRSELIAGRYAVSIVDATQRDVWRKELTYKTPQSGIDVQVPADLLATGRYVIALSAIEDKGKSEVLDEYAFRINR